MKVAVSEEEDDGDGDLGNDGEGGQRRGRKMEAGAATGEEEGSTGAGGGERKPARAVPPREEVGRRGREVVGAAPRKEWANDAARVRVLGKREEGQGVLLNGKG